MRGLVAHTRGSSRRLSRGLLLIALGCLTACASSSGEDSVEEESAAIVGGTADPADVSIVAVLTLEESETGEALTRTCTGTTIGPRTVLTAAHCVSPKVVAAQAKTVIMWAPDVRRNLSPEVMTRAARVHCHPDYEGLDDRAHDVCLVETEGTLPGRPIELATNEPTETEVRVVGYGDTSHLPGSTSGERREARMPMVVEGSQLVVGSLFSSKICQGDSGGPVLARRGDREVLVGVVTRGRPGCIASGFATRVDQHQGFLATRGSRSR